jgi:hypothetical protein
MPWIEYPHTVPGRSRKVGTLRKFSNMWSTNSFSYGSWGVSRRSTEESQKRGPRTLPEATERALLKALLDKSSSIRTFKDICDCQPDLLGTTASEFQKRVQHQRQYYLLSNPSYLQLAVSTCSLFLLQGEITKNLLDFFLGRSILLTTRRFKFFFFSPLYVNTPNKNLSTSTTSK